MTKEKQFIAEIYKSIRVPSFKQNLAFESDSEIITLKDKTLAITSDTLYEEIAQGIFKDLYAIGWYSAVMSISDIFATGSLPLGLLINLSLPENMDEKSFSLLITGIEDCCKKHNTYILGGDTNFGKELSIASFGIGETISPIPIKRNQIKKGEYVFVTKNVGTGNLTAFLNLSGHPDNTKAEKELIPVIDPIIAFAINKFASSCIDTSDGLLNALFDLLEQNKTLGIKINTEEIPFHPLVVQTASQTGIPDITFAAGEVGDYGLLFTIKPESTDKFYSFCKQNNLAINCIGKTISQQGLFLDNKKINPFQN